MDVPWVDPSRCGATTRHGRGICRKNSNFKGRCARHIGLRSAVEWFYNATPEQAIIGANYLFEQRHRVKHTVNEVLDPSYDNDIIILFQLRSQEMMKRADHRDKKLIVQLTEKIVLLKEKELKRRSIFNFKEFDGLFQYMIGLLERYEKDKEQLCARKIEARRLYLAAFGQQPFEASREDVMAQRLTNFEYSEEKGAAHPERGSGEVPDDAEAS